MTDYQIMPPLDTATHQALRDSIEHRGVLVPVVIDQHANILDGHQRLRIAQELGVDCPRQVQEVRDEDDGREIARTLNEDRRQLLDIDQRRVEVRRLREQGHSQRAIAGALGIGRQVVRDDLKSGGLSNPPDDQVPVETLPTEPDRVKGKDGKSYPGARRTLTDSQLEELMARRAAGESYKDLAEGVGVTPHTLKSAVGRYHAEHQSLTPKAITSAKARADRVTKRLARVSGGIEGVGVIDLVDVHAVVGADCIREWLDLASEIRTTTTRFINKLKQITDRLETP